MAKLNNYGIVSGWYLFELADKAGQDFLHKRHPDVKYFLTASVEYGHFCRQCQHDAQIYIRAWHGAAYKPYLVYIIIREKNTDDVIAEFEIRYVAKDHLAVEAKK